MAQRWIEEGKDGNGMVLLTAFIDCEGVLVVFRRCARNLLTSFWTSDMLTSKQEVGNGFTRL